MSELQFDITSGVIVPSTESIREDLASAVQKAFVKNSSDPLLNVDPVSPMGQVVDLMVAEIEAKNSEIAFMASQNNLKLARGVFLDALATLYFLQRKTSEPTVVSCICSGLQGTVIPYGAIVSTNDGIKLRHSSTSGVTIDASGEITTTFETVEHGAIQIDADTVTNIDSVIVGWDSVNNPSAGSLGRDEESDADFLNRIFYSVSINSRGTVSAIKSGISAVDGVIDCAVLENNGNTSINKYGVAIEAHSVAISVFGGEDTDIAEAIYRKKDVGCGTTGNYHVSYTDTDYNAQTYTYNIIRPVATSFKVKVVFYDALDDSLVARIKSTIISELNGENENPRFGVAQTIYASRLIVALGTALPKYAVKSLTIALGDGGFNSSVVIDADKEPTIDADNISVSTD